MRWSKLRQRIEDNFAESVAPRVRVFATRERRAHDQMGRGAIVVDGDVWLDACALKWGKAYYDELDKHSNLPARECHEAAALVMEHSNRIDSWDFSQRLFDYLNTSVEEALTSGDVVHRALAILDRRVGIRRLKKLSEEEIDNELLERFLMLRLSSTKLAQSNHEAEALR